MQNMLGLCEAENGTNIDELLKAGACRHTRARQDVETNSGPRRRHVPAKKARNWENEGQKRRIIRKEHRRLSNEFEMGGFMAQ